MNKEADTYKIFRQLEERKKRANPYSFYDKDELIDEILKNEDELERYKNIIDELEKDLYSININATYQEIEEVYRKMLRRIKELKGSDR